MLLVKSDIRYLAALAAAAALSSCAAGVSAPRAGFAETGAAFRSVNAPTVGTGTEPAADWWAGFSDREMSGLVETALRRHAGLLAADAEIDQAEALLRQASLNRSISTASRWTGEYGLPPRRDLDPQLSANAQAEASWEADLWGRLRALAKSARFDVEAAHEGRRDLAVVVASETALAYIDLRGGQTRLDVATRNAESQRESVELVRALLRNGRATQVDLERSIAQYRATLALVPLLEADVANAVSRLAALTADAASNPSDALAALTRTARPIPVLAGPLASGSPEALLRRRPDIRAAEAAVGAELALTQAARADLFPALTLSASGVALFGGSPLADAGSNFGFGLGPAVTWAGPDLRAGFARIRAADARATAAVERYRQTVYDALRDAETALTDYIKERARDTDLKASRDAAANALKLATLRFREGLDDYLDVLDAQRTLLEAEDRLALHQIEAARRAVRAYRSLGGVWDDEALAAFRKDAQS